MNYNHIYYIFIFILFPCVKVSSLLSSVMFLGEFILQKSDSGIALSVHRKKLKFFKKKINKYIEVFCVLIPVSSKLPHEILVEFFPF